MIYKDYVERIWKQSDLTKDEARRIARLSLDIITKSIQQNEPIDFAYFFKVQYLHVPPRIIRHPETKKEYYTPPGVRIFIVPRKPVKKQIQANLIEKRKKKGLTLDKIV